MDIRSGHDEDKEEEMTLNSKPSTPDPPNSADTSNTAPVIDRDDKIEATEKLLED